MNNGKSIMKIQWTEASIFIIYTKQTIQLISTCHKVEIIARHSIINKILTKKLHFKLTAIILKKLMLIMLDRTTLYHINERVFLNFIIVFISLYQKIVLKCHIFINLFYFDMFFFILQRFLCFWTSMLIHFEIRNCWVHIDK